jgi:HlyD family secretion protein
VRRRTFISGRKRWLWAGLPILVAGLLGARYLRSAPVLPTAQVQRGDLDDQLELRGEVKAVKSVILSAPSGAGDLQIIRLVKNGASVKKGDTLVQFDITTQAQTLQQKQTELKQAEAEIDRIKAESKIQEEQDLTDLEQAKFNVERARLDVSKQEILSEIEGHKAQLALQDAQQKLKEVEQKLASDRNAAKAQIDGQKTKRDKALFDVRRAETSIARMTLRAPVNGMVTLLPNFRAGNFGSAPEFREGDHAWPGAGIVELPELDKLTVSAQTDEAERGRLDVGQHVSVRVDAVPAKEFDGHITELSPLTKADFSSWPPAQHFIVTVALDSLDQRLRPGMSAKARVTVARAPNVFIVPTEALFQRGSRTVVYVANGRSFEERAVQLGLRTSRQVAVLSGVGISERVALRDPTLAQRGEP